MSKATRPRDLPPVVSAARLKSLFDGLDKPEETTAVKENAAEAAPLSRDGALKLRFSQALAIPPAL